GLDRPHARDVDAHLGTERARRLGRHLAPLGEHVDQRQLDLEPAREARFLGPEPPHLGPGVAVNHVGGPRAMLARSAGCASPIAPLTPPPARGPAAPRLAPPPPYSP